MAKASDIDRCLEMSAILHVSPLVKKVFNDNRVVIQGRPMQSRQISLLFYEIYVSLAFLDEGSHDWQARFPGLRLVLVEASVAS